jgi:glutathione S-transferase
MGLPTLYAASFSPWTERARWALDHHALPYRKVEHTVLLGEPLVRLKTGKWSGPLSFPIFLDGELRIFDSVDIARHADVCGAGPKLFRPEQGPEIDQWIIRSTDLLEAGRSILMPRLAADRDARRESLPRPLQAFAPLLDPLTRRAVEHVRRKYHMADAHAAERAIRGILEAVRQRLQRSGTMVEGGFSFADIAVAAAMQMVKPVSHPAMRLGAAQRGAWTQAGLAGEFADVLAWRDRVYRDRPRPAER